jgi:hypothetical protein
MKWKDLAKQLANLGLPIIGAAVGGPAGAVVGKGLAAALGLGANATPEQTAAALGQVNGDQLVALKSLDAQMAKDQLEATTAQIEAVNKTLQTEAMGGSWLQKNHHAIESMFTVGLVGAIYFILPLAKLPVPAVPEAAWLMLGAILGVTAWQRGAANVATAKNAE